MEKTMVLCQGRHEMPVSEFIFENTIEDITDLDGMKKIIKAKLIGVDKLVLYITGLTVAVVAVINYCCEKLINLTLLHFNSVTETYFPQVVETQAHLGALREGGYY